MALTKEQILAELRAARRNVALKGKTLDDLTANGKKTFKDKTGVSIGEALRMEKYDTEEGIDATTGRRLRQFAQGATFGLGDQIAGVGAFLVPGGRGYREAQQESKAGIEEFRREKPLEALALETAGGIATGVGSGFTAGKLGLSAATSGLLKTGAASTGRPVVQAASKLGQGIGKSFTSSQGRKRVIPNTVLGLGEGALYGLDYDSPGTGATIGGVTRGLISATPLGRPIARSIRDRSGDLEKATNIPPTGLLDTAKNTLFNKLNPKLQERVRNVFERRVPRGVDEGDQMAIELARGTGVIRDAGENLGVFTGTTGTGNLLPIVGRGTKHWTETAEDIGQLLQAPLEQRGLIQDIIEDVGQKSYGPLDDLFSSGFRATNNNIDELNRLHTGADKLTVRGVNNTVDGEIGNLRDLISRIEGNETTKGLFTKAKTQLVNNPNATVTIRKIVQGEPTPVQVGKASTLYTGKPGPFKVVKEVKNVAEWTADDILEASKDPAYLAKFLDDLGWNANTGKFTNPGQLPDLRSMQQLRNSLRNKAGDPRTGSGGSEHARMVLDQLEGMMERLYPGLKQADALFSSAKNIDDVVNVAAGRGTKVGLRDAPKEILDDLKNARDPIGGKNPLSSLENLTTWVRSFGADAAQKEALESQFLATHFQKYVMAPLAKGPGLGTKKAAELFDYLNGREGRAYLERFVRNSDPGIRKQQADLIMDNLRLLSMKITNPERRQTIMNALKLATGATLIGGVASQVFGGGGDRIDPERPTF